MLDNTRRVGWLTAQGKRGRRWLTRQEGELPSLGNLIFGSDFWDSHQKRNSDSVFDSKDSGQKFFSNAPVEKSRNQNSDSIILNSETNTHRNSIHLILHAMSIMIGQLVGLTMSNHMDVGLIPSTLQLGIYELQYVLQDIIINKIISNKRLI